MILVDTAGNQAISTWNSGPDMHTFSFQSPEIASSNIDVYSLTHIDFELLLDGYSYVDQIYTFIALDHWWLYGKTISYRPGVLASQVINNEVTLSISDFRLNGTPLVVGDFSRPDPTLKATFLDNTHGLKSWQLIVRNSDTQQIVFDGGLETLNAITSHSLTVEKQVTPPLSDGHYVIEAIGINGQDEATSANSGVFEVSSDLAINRVLAGPTPVNLNLEPLTFQYQLTQNADIFIVVFSISGERLWETHISSGTSGGMAGLNKVVWNGKNGYGEVLANGPYVAYVKASNDAGEVHSKVKLLVLK